MADVILLRNLPGVADLERRMNLPNAEWAAENDNLRQDIDKVSVRLFGIAEADTEYHWRRDLSDEDNARAFDLWELNFKLAYCDFEEGEPVWLAMGWDITDGAGVPLTCAWEFDRQIVCASKGLRGHLPILAAANDEAEAENAMKSAETWAEALAKDARRFKRQG
jgi:hypothetical protein